MQFQQGLVRSVSADALVIDLTHRYETSWEDYCKEYIELHDSQPQTQTIRIESVARQPPTLFYNGANLTFKCSDSEAYAAFFVQVRAKYGAAAESR